MRQLKMLKKRVRCVLKHLMSYLNAMDGLHKVLTIEKSFLSDKLEMLFRAVLNYNKSKDKLSQIPDFSDRFQSRSFRSSWGIIRL
jgi:hypothetical protein